MGVPFEALLPYAIMLGVSPPHLEFEAPAPYGALCLALAERDFRSSGICRTEERGQGIQLINGIGKVLYTLFSGCSHDVDEYTVMDRDRRLTGFLRGQTDNPTAPPGFELNNPWRLEKRFY
ncbi:hypothetical protein LHYA1_G006841 [Lachnellula hyalina]|uniref:NADH dehydrogenase [ubiquinone] 1 alpha subcomplex subunit 1 n=1 Tax=Lachnellula hyalina TaxID=1316788 RepID=A0A8H8QXY9_9HELO|nr:uncharacterized protein LHYA1_G006841 [Lachnellula hyalina]TVY24783.1 hypothetical protein LHYA1_G006841 [Lachnellula hyalina]